MTVRLVLFGSPAIEYGGKALALPFERRSQLLAFLALKRAWVGRAELAAMFWPDQATKLAYTNLRKTLFRLQSVPWGAGIDVQAGALRFEAQTDVGAFDAALREQRLADALPLRRGEMLAGFDDDANDAWSSWLGFERDRLRVAWRSAALEHLSTDIDPAQGIELSARLLEADPLDEAALRVHMDWLSRGGQAPRARAAYRAFTERLADDLGLAPGAELKALHDTLGSMPAPTKATSPRLSEAPGDGFVGRNAELRRIADLLSHDDCRLLCIVGAGGVGKTRLAQRAIRDFSPGFADGAVFVALEDVPTASELGGRIARELRSGLAGGGDPLQQVIEFLRERHVLLVLDNFEHLVADAALLTRLLEACPGLRMIVTSRVRLALPMERLMPLDGMPWPEAEDLDRVEAFDAVRLFVNAAQRVEPAFIAAVEADAIVDICRQVEGLPLALELAAAWTRVLSCAAIAAELRQGTELLRAVDAAHPARHASIDVVFEQSWRLLTPVERDTLARLSVFRGGFSAQAARAVAGASLAVLAALADKSLLKKDKARIFLHPLVQQLAGGRLAQREDRAETEEAHAAHFHRLLVQLRRSVENGDRDALDEIETEFENCRVAWRWAVASEEGQYLAQMAPTLFYFMDHRGRFVQCVSLLAEALESRSALSDPNLAAQLRGYVSHLEYRQDRYADAEATAGLALATARSTRDHDTQAMSLQVLGSVCLRLGRFAEARRLYQQARRHALVASDSRKAAVMLHNMAVVERADGNHDQSLRLFLDAMARHKTLGDVAGEALCLTNLSLLHEERGEHASAIASLKAALAISDRHGFLNTRAIILANLTGLAVTTGDFASAEDFAGRGLEIAQATSNRYLVAFLKLQLVRLAARRDNLGLARAELAAAVDIAIAIGRPALLLGAVSCLAEVLEAQGDADCAYRVLSFSADHPATNAPEREDLQRRMARLPSPTSAASPKIGLDDLVHRMVVERDLAYAPLIAFLRGTR